MEGKTKLLCRMTHLHKFLETANQFTVTAANHQFPKDSAEQLYVG